MILKGVLESILDGEVFVVVVVDDVDDDFDDDDEEDDDFEDGEAPFLGIAFGAIAKGGADWQSIQKLKASIRRPRMSFPGTASMYLYDSSNVESSEWRLYSALTWIGGGVEVEFGIVI